MLVANLRQALHFCTRWAHMGACAMGDGMAVVSSLCLRVQGKAASLARKGTRVRVCLACVNGRQLQHSPPVCVAHCGRGKGAACMRESHDVWDCRGARAVQRRVQCRHVGNW